MYTTDDKREIVQRGVKSQALMDKHLATAHKHALEYASVIEDAVEGGFFSSGLAAKQMLAKARTLPGLLAEAALLAAELHLEGTALAIENDVDLGSVDTVGGVKFTKRDDGMVHPMGGGGR